MASECREIQVIMKEMQESEDVRVVPVPLYRLHWLGLAGLFSCKELN